MTPTHGEDWSESVETILMEDNVKAFLLPQTHTIRQAMEQLEKTEEKIVFVVDEESRLVGSLTDGDIRRWILSDGDLKAEVLRVCNRSPYVAKEGFAIDQLRIEMLNGNFGCVPVISSSREIVQLVFWKELLQGEVGVKLKRQLNLPVVIMAGGRGTRLAPFTNVLPKPLIPVGDKTIIELIIDQFLPYGLDQFHLSINYKSKILKSFFEELSPEYSVSFLEEREPRGTAGALRALYSPVSENLIVTNCDIVIEADLAELVSFHQDNDYDLTLVASLKDYNIPYGVCELEKGGCLARIKEKPQYSFLINTGMYVVRRDRLDLIPEEAKCDMTDFIEEIKRAGGRIGVFPIGENAWTDTGEWTEYRKALDHLGRLSSRATAE
jgi:dTDP-glucose pyrophosphorylase/tetrahydromethanopterin S-methyltransferase subunit G